MSRWLRWYEGTCEDGKFRVVARKSRVTVRDVIALWAFMLEDAAHLDHRGVCERDEDFMAGVLDFEDGQVESILGAMEDVGLISVGPGAISLCNFDKRQFESDVDRTAAERQRNKRTRDKQTRNKPVTRDSRPPETETETDISEPKGSSPRPWALPVGVSLIIWQDFLKNRKRKRLVNTDTSWKTFTDDLVRVSAETGIPPPKLIELCTGKGWGGIYDPRNDRNDRQSSPGIGRTEQAAIAALGNDAIG